jgi:hypothetical protein
MKPPTLSLLEPQTSTDLLWNPLPSCKPLRTLTAFTDHYKTFSTRYVLHIILYSMADISKQISEGQKKWSQEVNLMFINDINNYIKFKVFEYGHYKLMNDDLWE